MGRILQERPPVFDGNIKAYIEEVNSYLQKLHEQIDYQLGDLRRELGKLQQQE